MMDSVGLTMICSLAVFADKRHIAPRLSLVNVVDLNKVLRSEVFVSEDRQLRVVHLILDFKPISNNFQEVGHAIRSSDPRLRQIDVFIPRFLARKDIVPVELPSQRAIPEATVPREETASSRLSFEEDIDQFQLEEEEEVRANPMQIPNSKGKFNRSSATRSPQLIITEVNSTSEEEDSMALNLRKGLRELMVGRNKGSSSKEAPNS